VAVAIAKRTASKPLKVLAAAALYGAAVVIWLVAVAALRS
jgi:hypothetical protein